ncbi:hypothetical protein [Negadavirga shengliensis]|uniref:Outer membrane porin, OprD family n=1 Tax=Negadavirga shengliensis TaxID=1389218 RepID=A0ABV9T1B2_9BACT
MKKERCCLRIARETGLLWLVLFFPVMLQAQEKHYTADSVTGHGKLASLIKSGEFEFHMRSFYMQTINKGDLMDYASWAQGAGLGYYSPSFKGFHVGFSGFFVFQVFENNLRVTDPRTGSINRYEILLYDMNDYKNRKSLDRLEHLYLSYLRKNFHAVFGRQKVNTPLLNEQDNRMRPNVFSGLTLHFHPGKWSYTTAWYSHLTMRGTVDWYTIGNSFGVYPFGRNTFGTTSDYKGNIKSKGIGVLGISWVGDRSEKAQVWNYTAENVFNLSFGQLEKKMDFGKTGLELGAQGFYQMALNEGGNPDSGKTYIMPGEKSHGYGFKVGFSNKSHGFSLNMLRIGSNGRFLFPREWGRENFFASLPRERFEGNGDVSAWTIKYSWSSAMDRLKGNVGMSSVRGPDLNSFYLNKYGIPSYYHFSGSLDYAFSGYLEGMDLKLLVVNKTARHPGEVPDRFRINRVDLWNLNLIMDFRF